MLAHHRAWCKYPEDPDLAAVIGELTMKSPEFAAMASEHKVRKGDLATYRMNHPLVGPKYPTSQALPIPQEADQRIVVATAEADSPARTALLPEEVAVATVVLGRVREGLLCAVACGRGRRPRAGTSGARRAEEGEYPLAEATGRRGEGAVRLGSPVPPRCLQRPRSRCFGRPARGAVVRAGGRQGDATTGDGGVRTGSGRSTARPRAA
ncbi:hypothetical protein [Streptomyces sp. NBC_00986]|uniref:MmyB family transcriptional regulator n=1 Tax=Streptomyces sp. NBC_00986 TaxID=2903702 RepID=UPI00386833D2